MKIAISGAQSTGKTTIIKEMRKWLVPLKKHKFLFEITREVNKLGLPINEEGNNITQLFILNSHLERCFKYKNSVLDRCILDGLVYTQYLFNNKKVDYWVLSYARRLFDTLINEYDIIFYIQPEFDIAEDGVRSTNIIFRNEIKEIFNTYIILCNNIVFIKGTVDERLNQIYSNIKERIK